MDIHTILLWLTMCPWSTARNLVELTGLGVSSINRALDDYYNLGWVVSRMIGRGSRATRLWILASEFLELYYAVDHVHGHAGGPDGHRHHPLHPGLVNHKHIPWHLRAAGVRRLYSRLEPHLYFYEIRDRLFREAGQALLRYVDGGTPVLKSWEPIRRGQLAEVVAIYENEHAQFVIVFCWLGKQLKIGRMLEKWYYRFSNLRGTSRARQMVRDHNILDPPDSPPDEDFNDTPQPSLYVMVGQDEYIVRRAMVFSVNYFCRFRRLFLPVHPLFPTALLGHSGAVAGDVEFQDDRVVDHPVDGRSRGHRVGEDVLPLGEDQVGRDAQGPAFVAFGDEREEHLGLLGPLGQVPQVVQQQEVVVVELS